MSVSLRLLVVCQFQVVGSVCQFEVVGIVSVSLRLLVQCLSG